MKLLLSTLAILLFSTSVTAQEVKSKVKAKHSEEQEIAADNRLKKSIQQKQLSAPPSRIADVSTNLNTGKKMKSKTAKCCMKKKARV